MALQSIISRGGGGVTNTTAPRNYQQDLESILPGISGTLGQQLGNINNLISGTESPAITQNMNAYWGANSGLAPGSEFLRNRAVDLFGERSAQRQAQGGQDLLGLLGGVSAPLSSYRGQDVQRELGLGGLALGQGELGQRQYEFGKTFPESQRQFDITSGNQMNQFQQDLDLRKMLGVGNLNLSTLQSYLQYLSP